MATETKPPYTADLFLEDGENSCSLDCGCTLDFAEGDPRFWYCPMHAAAERALALLKRALKQAPCLTLSLRGAIRKVIAKAKGA